MIEVDTFFVDEIDLWKSYFGQLPSEYQSVYHSPDYMAFLQDVGMGKAVCQVFRDGECFVYFPGLLQPLPWEAEGYDMMSSWYYGGPLCNLKQWRPFDAHWTEAIVRSRSDLNVVSEFIRCDPNQRNHVLLTSPYKIRYDRPTVVVNLHTTWEKVVNGFSSQNRRNIKKAQRCGLTVLPDGSNKAWIQFAHIYQEEMLRKNAPSHLRFGDYFFGKLKELKGFTLFVVKSGEEIIGGFVSAHGAFTAHHYLSAVRFATWDSRPNNLLFTEVLAHFWQRGYKLFDFQGGRDGVFRFKTNFSKTRGAFYVAASIYDQPKYDMLTRRAAKIADVTYFPSYRVP